MAGISSEPWGLLPDGSVVTLFTLTNDHDIQVRVIDYGGIIVSIRAPDRTGQVANVTLGFDTLEGYLHNTPYLGALIGRVGNRIAKARFELDGAVYSLAANDGANHLHGGLRGFDSVLWNAAPFESAEGVGLVLTRISPDQEEGYPGRLDLRVRYLLTAENELVVDYGATTDKPTVLNLTQHAYFNLAGDVRGDVLGHVVQIHAEAFTPIDETLIPTGEIRSVAGTPLDFRRPTAIGARIDAPHEQIVLGGGYDHNFVLGEAPSADPKPAARVVEPTSGRVLEVRTTEPGVQLYTGNFLDGTLVGAGGAVFGRRTGFCLETQHFPDAPNKPNFPTTVLRPGQTFRSQTAFRFSVE